MNHLLNDRLSPITSELGFLEIDLVTVSNWFLNWRTPIETAVGGVVKSQNVKGSLDELLNKLLPLTSVLRRRYLFVACENGWTAYFDNGWQGSDAAGLAHLARELKCRAVRAVAIRDSKIGNKVRYGATIFELYGPLQTEFLNYVRSIALVNDGGQWKFTQAGTQLSFEEPAVYKSRLVRSRFPTELLVKYLVNLGINAFDEFFYKNAGVLVDIEGVNNSAVKEYSLAEVQSYLGIDQLRN